MIINNKEVSKTRAGKLICSYCAENKPEPAGIVIFGASGDLTKRKLIPALFSLYKKKSLPENFFILGCARSEIDISQFKKNLLEFIPQVKGNKVLFNNFFKHISYISISYNSLSSYLTLKKRINILEKKFKTKSNLIFNLAVPPTLYVDIALNIGSIFVKNNNNEGYKRLIFEKPFGYDLESSKKLDKKLHSVLNEKQIYRIDHYLGKETVQNILMLRFANAIFEPIWNRQYIDHIQITVAESLGIGNRAGFYDQTGLLRDMFQNHMMQMLALVTMEPPISFEANRMRDEIVKLMRSVRPFKIKDIKQNIIRAQYAAGKINNKPVKAYKNELNIKKESIIETYMAAKLYIDNWRWQGVPIYMRSGKRLPYKSSEIIIAFKEIPYSMFKNISGANISRNLLILKVQPDESMSLIIQAKQPGTKLCMASVGLDFKYKDFFVTDMPDSYERLLLDVMLGDQTLFWRSDAVSEAWKLFTPVLKYWEKNKNILYYPAGSWGPVQADNLLKTNNNFWYNS